MNIKVEEFYNTLSPEDKVKIHEIMGKNVNEIKENNAPSEAVKPIIEKIDSLKQGSKQWLSERKKTVTASLVPVLFNYCYSNETLEAHLLDKVFNLNLITITKSRRDSMSSGLSAEDTARMDFSKSKGFSFTPTIFKRKDIPLLASLDGYSEMLDEVLELKCCNVPLHDQIKESNTLPIHFYLQIQAQLMASGAKMATCVCIRTCMGGFKNAVKIDVFPNPDVIKKITEAVKLTEAVLNDLKHGGYQHSQLRSMMSSNSGLIGTIKQKISNLQLESIPEIQKHLKINCEQLDGHTTTSYERSMPALVSEYKRLQQSSKDKYGEYKKDAAKMELIRGIFKQKAGYFIGEANETSSFNLGDGMEIERQVAHTLSSSKLADDLQKLSLASGLPFDESRYMTSYSKFSVKKTYTGKSRYTK